MVIIFELVVFLCDLFLFFSDSRCLKFLKIKVTIGRFGVRKLREVAREQILANLCDFHSGKKLLTVDKKLFIGVEWRVQTLAW